MLEKLIFFLCKNKRRAAYYKAMADYGADEVLKLQKEITLLEDRLEENIYKNTVKEVDYLLHSPNRILCDIIRADACNLLIMFEFDDGCFGDDVYEFYLQEVTDAQGKGREASLNFSVRDGKVKIQEIDSPANSGWGSLLMKYLLRFAPMVKGILIYGWLSPDDLDDIRDAAHKDRLLHFYQKHGFVITDCTDKGGKWAWLQLETDE